MADAGSTDVTQRHTFSEEDKDSILRLIRKGLDEGAPFSMTIKSDKPPYEQRFFFELRCEVVPGSGYKNG